jgi:hypothetical protein
MFILTHVLSSAVLNANWHSAVKAKALAQAGCMNLLDLISKQEYLDKLSTLQITNLKYMDHLDSPATREVVEQVLVSPRFS